MKSSSDWRLVATELERECLFDLDAGWPGMAGRAIGGWGGREGEKGRTRRGWMCVGGEEREEVVVDVDAEVDVEVDVEVE